jgi:hypothetical protein
MNTRILTILSLLALLGFSANAVAHSCDRHENKSHKHCANEPGGGDGESIVYTAELTGAFVFNTLGDDNSIVVVTPNKRESSLHGEPLDISIPGYNPGKDSWDCERITDEPTYDACMTWHHVFNTCPLLLNKDSVEGFYVGADNWSIQRPGGVYVQLVDIALQGAKISMNLYGDKSVNTDPFLPPVGEPSEFILGEFATWGKGLPGAGPNSGCEPFENRPLGYYYIDGEENEQFKETNLQLVITATDSTDDG